MSRLAVRGQCFEAVLLGRALQKRLTRYTTCKVGRASAGGQCATQQRRGLGWGPPPCLRLRAATQRARCTCMHCSALARGACVCVVLGAASPLHCAAVGHRLSAARHLIAARRAVRRSHPCGYRRICSWPVEASSELQRTLTSLPLADARCGASQSAQPRAREIAHESSRQLLALHMGRGASPAAHACTVAVHTRGAQQKCEKCEFDRRACREALRASRGRWGEAGARTSARGRAHTHARAHNGPVARSLRHGCASEARRAPPAGLALRERALRSCLRIGLDCFDHPSRAQRA